MSDQSKSKLKRWPCISLATSPDLVEFSAHFRVFFDLIHKHLHISSGEAVAGDPSLHLAAGSQQSLLILIERREPGWVMSIIEWSGNQRAAVSSLSMRSSA